MKKSNIKKITRNITLAIIGIIVFVIIAEYAINRFSYDVKGDANRIPVFVYHRFCSNVEEKHLKSAQSLTVSEKKLEEQMKFLHNKGYKTISMEEFEKWYNGEIELPRKTVMITIDDGKYSAVKYALPIFEKYGIKSTMFIIGDRTESTTNTTAGEDNLHSVGLDVLEDLEKNHPNFAVQSHTYSMHKWDENDSPKIYNYTKEMCAEDLKKQEDMFGFKYLAYPFGAYTDLMIEAIKEQGNLQLAFTYGNNRYATREQDRYKIERIKVNGKKGIEEFSSWLDEGYPMVKTLTSNFVSNDKFDKINNTFSFASSVGDEYIIMRKNFLIWEDVDVVKGQDGETTWVDENVNTAQKYKYSVKRILEKDSLGNIIATTPYDEKGLKTLNKVVKPKANYTNLRTEIKFVRKVGVSGYKVYRKFADSDYEFLVDKKQRKYPIISYSDVYRNTCSDGAIHSRITFKNFIDPSYNDLVYTARPFIEDKDRGTLVMGPMFLDGDFRVADPSIVDVHKTSPETATVWFATVPNAKRYTIFSGKKNNDAVDWNERAIVEATSDARTITKDIEYEEGDDYFTVQAEFEKNGKKLYSGMEQNYTTQYRKVAAGKKVLVIGASSSYGCPYKKSDIRFIFSYPYRMANMLGAEVMNPSIPGATYSSTTENRAHILTDMVNKIELGQSIDRACYGADVLDRNLQLKKLTDFDIILVVAGGNDYNMNLNPGNVDSRDTGLFAGAVNTILDKICSASAERIVAGKSPTTIIMIGTTYSDRRGAFSQLNNRYTTPNTEGYTLQDFQDVFEEIGNQYKGKKEVNVYLLGSEEMLNQETCPTATTDNLHMTRITNGEFGAYIAKEFAEQGMLK